MNYRIIIYNLGRIISVAAALFMVPLIVSVIYHDGCIGSFLIPYLLMEACGLICLLARPKIMKAYAKEGFVTVAVMWIVFSLFGALPFTISGSIPSYIDAFFETVSGFTTTGSTILTNIEILPKSILFWRSLTHWVGGMGVLALAIAILPTRGSGDDINMSSVHILKAETPGPTFGKLTAKLSESTRILYTIYAVLTLAEVILLLLGGMNLFDSLVTSFGTAGTGGFSNYNTSIAYFDSAYFDVVIGIFMLLFGVNFNIYYMVLTGRVAKALKSEELRAYLIIVAVSVGLITVNILGMYDNALEALRYAFFQVSSIITTTGYATCDFDLWPTFSKIILVTLMFIGACAGSTGGGIKVSRILIMAKTAIKEMKYQKNPREVHTVVCDNEIVQDSVVKGVESYIIIYIALMVVSTLAVAIDGKSPTTTFTAVIACVNNIGPGLEEVGATGNFANFSRFSKLVLSFDMLAGRLEIYPMLVLFTPSVSKSISGFITARRKAKRENSGDM